MANKKYTELPQANAITGAEILAMVQDGGSVQGDIDLIKAYFDTLYAPIATVITAPASVTPTFNGLGTVTSITAYTWRVGSCLFFEVRGTAGTVTASEMRIGLRYNPGSGEVDVTTASTYPTLQLVGNMQSGTNTANYPILAEASKTYVTIGQQSVGTTAGMAKQLGSILSNSSVFSASGCVRIQGW